MWKIPPIIKGDGCFPTQSTLLFKPNTVYTEINKHFKMSHSQQAVDEPQGNEYMLLVVLASHKW